MLPTLSASFQIFIVVLSFILEVSSTSCSSLVVCPYLRLHTKVKWSFPCVFVFGGRLVNTHNFCKPTFSLVSSRCLYD